ncbi:alpha/beta hydrolase [Aestuariivirga sp.]|uniref:alpha/beta hydrolase n=1 Tax=Aestuariivirga sp. TaxID=2650926 RepID=UPI0039E452CF
MRALVIIFLAIASIFSGHAALAESFKADVFAEFFYRHGYPKVIMHKAMAVGPNYYWQTNWGLKTPEEAAETALKNCNDGLKKAYPDITEGCTLLDVDGVPKMPLETIGISLDAIAAGPDLPLDKGFAWMPEGKARGSVILIASCNRVQSPDAPSVAWADFYNALGYRVYLPDNFAEPRPPELCGAVGNRVEDQTTIIKQQMAQTRRTIMSLQARFPGEPIILHGMSQGGWVAQAVGMPVEAVISTATACGFGTTITHDVPDGVPFLTIAGSKDPLVPAAQSADGFSNACKGVIGPTPSLGLSVAGKTGIVGPWWAGAGDAVTALLKREPMPLLENFNLSDQQFDTLSNDYKQYMQVAGPKAWAQNGSTHSYVWQQSDLEEARNYALFYCASNMARNPYTEPLRMHPCRIVDATDGPPPK